jgi:predicted Zn-dependent peptidase
MTPEEAAEKVSAVTRDEVAECAAKVTVDTIYLLAPEKSELSEGSAE